MKYELKVPQQGETTEYVTITRWDVAVGDKVTAGQEIGEMESSKTTAPIECPFTGTVTAILKEEEEEADVGEVIAVIED
jgi:pyruvate/2-oxoglutarate dehydrogenase complex dihydrolipoamide acyltransferase (E2) component